MHKKIISSIFALVIASIATAQALTDKQLVAAFDSILNQNFKPDGPGAAAIVTRKGQVIYKKAFGLADIELNVPMQPDMIFRIGSITKQFTAIAILQLAEQKKLSLQDDIKKYLPDYPTNNQTITIEHLLTHTSGIKSYTNMQEFMEMMRTDLSLSELIDKFKNQPMDFTPGSKWLYNNSGYILLGYIIEKVSGKSYEQYVMDHLFTPAGMTNSSYDNTNRIVKNRVKGYEQGQGGYENAAYLSMSLPHAAGSLMSTVEDLAKWNKAVNSYKLVSKEWLDKAFTGFKLTDGKDSRYGYGWMMGNLQGSASIDHGGAINGFLSEAIYLPAEDVYVAILTNCGCKHPAGPMLKMAALAIGKPIQRKALSLDPKLIAEYAGVFENESGERRVIRFEDNKLTSQRGTGGRLRIIPFAADEFYFESNDLQTLSFTRDANGRVIKLKYSSRLEQSDWVKTDKPIPSNELAMKVDKAVLNSYVGEYELMPGFIITITVEGERIFAQATGQEKFEIFPQSQTKYFLKVVDAQVEFFKEGGKTTHLVLFQNGRELKGVKVR